MILRRNSFNILFILLLKPLQDYYIGVFYEKLSSAENSQASSQQSRHMWEQTKRSIPDVEGGNWPDFQRRLNPRLSESRPSLVGKRRRLSKSWHRPDWNFPCTIDSSVVVSCNIFTELYSNPKNQYSWLCKCALSILLCTVDSGDIVLCDLF